MKMFICLNIRAFLQSFKSESTWKECYFFHLYDNDNNLERT